jgi:hypothetical protein
VFDDIVLRQQHLPCLPMLHCCGTGKIALILTKPMLTSPCRCSAVFVAACSVMQQLVEQEAAIKSMQASTADAVAELREKLTQQQQAAQQLESTLQVWAQSSKLLVGRLLVWMPHYCRMPLTPRLCPWQRCIY